MEQRTDTYLGLIIILGVVATMIMVGILRDPYADSAGAAVSKTVDATSFVWINKVKYAPGEIMLIKWNVPQEYRDSLREVQLVDDNGGYFVLSNDIGILRDGELLAYAPDRVLSGQWHVRVTTRPYTAASPYFESHAVSVG